MEFLNLDLIAEISSAFYAVHLKRSKAVEILVVHFEAQYYYFLRRRRGKKVTIFFRTADSSRAWMRSALFSVAVTEDLINSFVNKVAQELFLTVYLNRYEKN